MKTIVIKISFIFSVAAALWTGGEEWNVLWSKTSSARIGILPFQVYSETKVDYLQDVIPNRLAQRIQNKGPFAVIDCEGVKRFVPEKETGWLSRKELDRIALQAGAQFLVFGSLTKIEENLSIDARVYTTLKESPSYKSFVEGKDLDHLIEELGSRISQHILSLAPSTPLTATPFGLPVEEELLAPDVPPTTAQLDAAKRPPDPETFVATPATTEEPPSASPEPLSSIIAPVPTDGTSSQEVSRSRPASALAPSEITQEAGIRPGKRISQSQTKPSYQPINITSDRMEADNRNRTVDFFGNVVAKREDMVIFSDRISAFYTEEGGIRKIIAHGNVKINQQDRIATCTQATFFQPSQKIVLTGKPKVWQGKNIVSGGKITISLNEDKIDIEGEGKNDRVNAIIYPMGKDLQ